MSWVEILDQDDFWTTDGGTAIDLELLSDQHRANVIGWLERNAQRLYSFTEWRLFVAGYQPTSDAASDAVDAAHSEFQALTPAKWLEETPLMKRLRELSA